MPLDTRRPFTRKEATAAGLSERVLRGPGFRRLLRGVYVDARAPDHPWYRTAAALLVHPPNTVATHTSAARLLGAPVPPDPVEHVTVPRAADRRPHHGVTCHVAALVANEIRVEQGLRISSPHRMFVELSSSLSLVDLVIVGDWLVRREHCTPESLAAYCVASGERHAAHARKAAGYVRRRVDSPMETRLRMLLVLAGLPEPEVNLRLRDEHGSVVARIDLSYPSVRIAIEYDGRQHVEVVEQWERDNERDEEYERDDWIKLKVTSKGIYREPENTIDRVWRALKKRQWPGLKPPTDEWRPHFGR